MSTQFSIPFDICERKHQGNTQSVRANVRAQPGKSNMRERIRVFLVGCEWHGATLKEIADAMDKQLNQISGRFSELKKAGVIFDSGRERDHCAVYVIKREWVNEHYACTKGE